MVLKAESIKRSTITDKVFATLHQWIVSGRLHAGDALPSQDELARQFEVSRNTLREAIFKLSALGLVEAKQGVGTVVLGADSDNYLSALQDNLLLDHISMGEFLETRIALETTIVKLVVARAKQEDFNKIDVIIEKQREAKDTGDVPEFIKQDIAFHVGLGHACGNRVMLRISRTVFDLLRAFISKVAGARDNIEMAYKYHREILESIKARNAEQAGKLMAQHIMETIRNFQMTTDEDLQLDRIVEIQPGTRMT
jgi:GntR family transcriptional regulator, transcriptional repressor for pyruvate dehydrogenase complex